MSELKDLYESSFDPKKYLSTYTFPHCQLLKGTYEMFHNFFNSDVVKGDTLLDAGCGPTIASVISASRTIKDITLSDLLEQNRNEVLKWKNKEDGAFDWTPVFKFYAELEKESDYTKLEARVRDAISSVIPLDILSDDPISFTKRTFDVVVTCAMIENASKDLDEYVTALKNINKLLNSKGYLVLIGSFDTTYYSFNDTKFPSVKLDKNLAEKSLNEAGFDVLQWDVREEKQDPSLFDCSSMFGLIAQKRN